MIFSTIRIGHRAESRALRYLKRHNLIFIARNYHCKMGEIDLIMQDNGCLVFIEVRKRSHDAYGSGLESVTYEKQQRVIRAAEHYLQKKALLEKVSYRFDIVSLDKNDNITWIKNTFS